MTATRRTKERAAASATPPTRLTWITSLRASSKSRALPDECTFCEMIHAHRKGSRKAVGESARQRTRFETPSKGPARERLGVPVAARRLCGYKPLPTSAREVARAPLRGGNQIVVCLQSVRSSLSLSLSRARDEKKNRTRRRRRGRVRSERPRSCVVVGVGSAFARARLPRRRREISKSGGRRRAAFSDAHALSVRRATRTHAHPRTRPHANPPAAHPLYVSRLGVRRSQRHTRDGALSQTVRWQSTTARRRRAACAGTFPEDFAEGFRIRVDATRGFSPGRSSRFPTRRSVVLACSAAVSSSSPLSQSLTVCVCVCMRVGAVLGVSMKRERMKIGCQK